jgi:HK97 gp10 family phage protein
MATVTGDRQVVAALRRIGKGPSAREVDTSANRAMSPMRDDARKRLAAHRNFASKWPSYFPKQQGPFGNHVDKGIVVRKDGKQEPGARSYKLGATGRARFLLHLLEFGTAAHFQPNLLGGWMHPGASPRPSFVPAFEHGKDAVIDVLQDDILGWLEREARGAGLRFTRGR